MKIITTTLLASAALVASSQGAFIIDTFNAPTSLVAVAGPGSTDTDFTPATQPFGAGMDIFIDNTAGVNGASALAFGTGSLDLAVGQSSTTSFILQWDGGAGATFVAGGVSGNITGPAFNTFFTIDGTVDGTWSYVASIIDGSGNISSSSSNSIDEGTGAYDAVEWGSYTGTADVTDVRGIQLLLTGTSTASDTADLTISLVSVPEPSSALFLGLSTLGLIGFRRRK